MAARLWLPDKLPAPALIEALPYRMDDLTASYASEYERLCREGGLAVARVDLRGTGSSESIAVDEYAPQEQADLLEVIAWLAAQDWCTGRIGMYGTSYSGFNSLQLAAERPPALGAICAIYASDDRYTDDVHYMGGALRALDLVDYVLYMAALTVLPPVPAVYGDGWRDEWIRRIEGSEPWLLRWLEEQNDGAYWRQGSLRPSGYDRITCPTMIVSGWADGYRNCSFRTFAALNSPKRMIVGPWSHMSPATSIPGPRIDLVPELVRWFRRWLCDEENGVDTEPPIRVFVRRSTKPEPDLQEMRGSWRFEHDWPLERSRTLTLTPEPPMGVNELDVQGDVGTSAWISCAGRLPWGQPADQREDDGRSLVYEWDVDSELEILGNALVVASVVSTAPVAYLSAKLCDVFPDGTSALVARGFLNLAHRASSTAPVALENGADTTVSLELEATSWIFEAGHRIRLSLAGADWPNTWPPPARSTLAVDRARLSLALPVVEGKSPVGESPAFADAPETSESQSPVVWRIERDVLSGETRAVIAHGAEYEAEFGAHVEERYEGAVGVSSTDPSDAWARATCSYRIRWADADVATEAKLDLRSDAETYHVSVEVIAEEGSGGIGRRARRFERAIPRKLQ